MTPRFPAPRIIFVFYCGCSSMAEYQVSNLSMRVRSPSPATMSFIICHYGEIALKGKNRRFFEERLVENIKLALSPTCFSFVKRISGRILIESKTNKNLILIKEKLSKVFGLTHFSFVEECLPAQTGKQDIKEIQEKSLEILKEKKFSSFKVDAKRAEKNFPLNSQQINERVGEYILNKRKAQSAKLKTSSQKIKVDLENPDITIFIEIVEKYCFIFTEKIKGQGGLPIGVSGKAVSLLSGGIDSPVASYMAMKRGLELIFVHFHAMPYTNKASIEKVKKLLEILKEFQLNSKLYLVPFSDIQKEIFLKTPAPFRVILYRRMMFRIAEKIALTENCKSIITGENLGQVASQTVENLTAIEKAANLLILRPLVGFDKKEIIELAEKIGTFKISILPHEDCCSRFLPEHPETKANIKKIEEAEKELDIEKLISNSINKIILDK